MAKKGRPPTRRGELREGYYLELRSKNSNSPIKIRRESMEEIEIAIQQYRKNKTVTYLGQVKEGIWVDGKNKGKKTV